MTDVLDPTIKPDGRHARGARTKAAVLDACRGLMRRGVYRPDMAAVAKKAGVSIRSAFEHFGHVEALWREAIDDTVTFNAIAECIFGSASALGHPPSHLAKRAVMATVLHERAGN